MAWVLAWLITFDLAIVAVTRHISAHRLRYPTADDLGYGLLTLLAVLIAAVVVTIVAPSAVYAVLWLDGDELARSTALWSLAFLLFLGAPGSLAAALAVEPSWTSDLPQVVALVIGPLALPPVAGRFVARWRRGGDPGMPEHLR